MKIKRLFFFFIITLSVLRSNNATAQNFSPEKQAQLDNLNQIINNPTSNDTIVVNCLLNIANYYYLTYPDTAIIICEKAKKMSEKINYTIGRAESYGWLGYLMHSQGQIEKALEYYHQSLKIKEKIGDKGGIATSLNNIGMIYDNQGKSEKALQYYLQSLKIKEKIGDKGGIATSLNNIGYIYYNQGQIEKALQYYHQSLKIQEEIGNKGGIALCLNNIGMIYDNQGQSEKALQYYLQCLKIKEKIRDKGGIAISLNNIGNVYYNQGQIEKALQYYHQSLKIQEEIGNKVGIALSLNNIGNVYYNQGQIEKALQYYLQSLIIQEEIGNKDGMTISLNNIGAIYKKQGNDEKAKEYCSKSLKIAKEIGNPARIRDASDLLTVIAQKQGNYKEAFDMYKLYIEMRDSINSEETYKAAVEQQAKYEYEKQALADSIANAETKKVYLANLATEKAISEKRALEIKTQRKQAIADSIANSEAKKVYLANLAVEKAKSEKRALEIKTQKRQKWYLYAGLSLVALFGGFMYNRFKITQKQKNIIEEQKTAVETQKKQIELQHKQLEETHKEISDSIKYAERLQLAILPPKEDIKTNLGESFVLFQPKDVVSGDFYWMQQIGDTTLFASADCTGHGVPGAMVSVVCSNALNRSVKEFGLIQPKDILEKTRELVIETFARSGKDVKDGMDIALCAKNGTQLTYAGANNPLWIVRKTTLLTEEQKEARSTVTENDLSLIEYKANKQPVGLYEGMRSFEQIEIPMYPGDTLYIFTDGFADQFGGEKGKKFKYKPFKKLLLSIQDKPMEEQQKIIDITFSTWKGNLEQIDDVCVIGVKI
jgi:tetratricopeptide (TPR) repeat protein/serine phosphatase RsbU (regulator of sigma subunit)